MIADLMCALQKLDFSVKRGGQPGFGVDKKK